MPVVSAEDGQWLLPEGLAPLLKPGGHGAIWKLMLDQGIFDWLSHHDREGAIVRQIRWVGWSMLDELPCACCAAHSRWSSPQGPGVLTWQASTPACLAPVSVFSSCWQSVCSVTLWAPLHWRLFGTVRHMSPLSDSPVSPGRAWMLPCQAFSPLLVLSQCSPVIAWSETLRSCPCCSNPMAGTDATLLSLSGSGYTDSRSFGFASCPRVVGAAEGMNVLMERRTQGPEGQWEHTYNVTNVEYTEFEKMGICDVPNAPGSQYSRFPANTNVLYVNMKVGGAATAPGGRRTECRSVRGCIR